MQIPKYNEITFIWFGQTLIGSQFLFLQISILCWFFHYTVCILGYIFNHGVLSLMLKEQTLFSNVTNINVVSL